MEEQIGAEWIIQFTKTLRPLLPNHIITHAPQAPYFNRNIYGGKNYIKVHNEVGSMIDFYNIQFYNQGSTTYDTYEKLFLESGGVFPLTSVKEIADTGVPLDKIILGKPAAKKDVANTGFIE